MTGKNLFTAGGTKAFEMLNVKILLLLHKLKLPVHLGALGRKLFTWALRLQRCAELPTGLWLCLTLPLPYLHLLGFLLWRSSLSVLDGFVGDCFCLSKTPWGGSASSLCSGSTRIMHSVWNMILRTSEILLGQHLLLHLLLAFASLFLWCHKCWI